MFQRFLQKIKKAWTLIKPALGHLATLITILGIGFIGIISPLTQSIEPLRIVKYTKIVEDIRIGSSEKYVESALGIPKRENKLEYVSAKGERYEIIRKDYLNEDFLYSAYFTDEEGLIGIGLISKNKYFRPRIPTKSALALLKYSQENFVPYSPWFIKANFSGTRADNSDFLLEFIGPPLATNGLFIAYGMSELGYINKSEEDYFYDYVVPLVIDEVNKRNTQTIEQILINKKEDRSKINPNAVFVMNELGDYDDSVGFINQEMEYMFLYSRIDYRLLNE